MLGPGNGKNVPGTSSKTVGISSSHPGAAPSQDSVTQEKTARRNEVVIFSVVMVGRLGLDLSQGLFILPFWTRLRLARNDKKQAGQEGWVTELSAE